MYTTEQEYKLAKMIAIADVRVATINSIINFPELEQVFLEIERLQIQAINAHKYRDAQHQNGGTIQVNRRED